VRKATCVREKDCRAREREKKADLPARSHTSLFRGRRLASPSLSSLPPNQTHPIPCPPRPYPTGSPPRAPPWSPSAGPPVRPLQRRAVLRLRRRPLTSKRLAPLLSNPSPPRAGAGRGQRTRCATMMWCVGSPRPARGRPRGTPKFAFSSARRERSKTRRRPSCAEPQSTTPARPCPAPPVTVGSAWQDSGVLRLYRLSLFNPDQQQPAAHSLTAFFFTLSLSSSSPPPAQPPAAAPTPRLAHRHPALNHSPSTSSRPRSPWPPPWPATRTSWERTRPPQPRRRPLFRGRPSSRSPCRTAGPSGAMTGPLTSCECMEWA